MRNFLTILKNECKIVFRTKIFYVVLLPLMYFLYYSIFDGVTSLTIAGYVVQILILVSMLIGYQNSVREEKENCLELLSLAKNRYTACLCKLLATEFYLLCLNICLIMVVKKNFVETNPLVLTDTVEYELHYAGTHMLCTNLKKNGDVYTGKSNAGVSLISGHLKETKAGSAKVYYTYDYSESFASKQTEQLIKMVKDLRSKLGMDETPVKQVFLVHRR